MWEFDNNGGQKPPEWDLKKSMGGLIMAAVKENTKFKLKLLLVQIDVL